MRDWKFSVVSDVSQLPITFQPSLTELRFDDNFNEVISDLPISIVNLSFSSNYSHPISLLPRLHELECNLSCLDMTMLSSCQLKTLKLMTFLDNNNNIYNNNIVFQPLIADINLITFPKTLTSLSLGNHFDDTIHPNTLPNTLLTLEFGDKFNQIIHKNTLPSSLTSLSFGEHFNQLLSQFSHREIKLIHTLPRSLKTLHFGFHFNQEIFVETLPNTLTELKLGSSFNNKFVLPTGLLYLTFGSQFNQPILPNVFPSFLKVLHFGCNFNQSIGSHNLPLSLNRLELPGHFNQQLDLTQFTSLTFLSVGHRFEHSLQNKIPSSLTHLFTSERYKTRFETDITRLRQHQTLLSRLRSLIAF